MGALYIAKFMEINIFFNYFRSWCKQPPLKRSLEHILRTVLHLRRRQDRRKPTSKLLEEILRLKHERLCDGRRLPQSAWRTDSWHDPEWTKQSNNKICKNVSKRVAQGRLSRWKLQFEYGIARLGLFGWQTWHSFTFQCAGQTRFKWRVRSDANRTTWET